jgi:uncharacterized protein
MAFSPDFRGYAQTAPGTAAIDDSLRAYMLRVYNWMASGLLLTGIVAYVIAHTSLLGLFYQPVTDGFGRTLIRPTLLADAAMLSPLAFVLVLSFGVNRLSVSAAQGLFWAFCTAMGASLTNIFLAYTGVSIVQVFFITAASFAGLSLYGYTTRRNLTGLGAFCVMGVWGLMLSMLVNGFLLHSAPFQLGISICGVLAFAGLTAFDTQRIKSNYVGYAYAGGQAGLAKQSVYDALSLYMNFINLFMFLLQIMGNRSDR